MGCNERNKKRRQILELKDKDKYRLQPFAQQLHLTAVKKNISDLLIDGLVISRSQTEL